MSLTRKLQFLSDDLSADQINHIARTMPRESAELQSIVNLPEEIHAKVLAITRAHQRDQFRFDECLSHVKAFARGGLSGVASLNSVHGNIFKHYDMEAEKWEILTAANVGLDFQTGNLYLKD